MQVWLIHSNPKNMLDVESSDQFEYEKTEDKREENSLYII